MPDNTTPAGSVPAGSPHLGHMSSGLAGLDQQAAQLTAQTGTPHHVVQDLKTDSFIVKPKG